MKTLPHSFNALASPLGFPPSTKVNPPPPAAENSWTTSLSASLYKIDKWGPPYFAVNSSGNISILPHGSSTLPHQEIDLLNIVKNVTSPKSAGGLGMQLPLIVRLPDILKDRVDSLNSAFQHAIKSHGYDSHYQGIYPVKSNHDRFIVEDIVRFGFSSRFGLEAGSKAELLLAMTSLCEANPEAFLICNGYKDCEYINLALIARKLAFNTFIVLEKEEELDIIIDLSKKLCVKPVIGVRAKLRTKHSGHYGSTSGEKGKFGLTTTQILNVVRKLDQVGMLECLQLLHFHIGSQIPTTKCVSEGVKEATQIYCELSRLGAHMKVLDIGGGLGIDYDGSKSAHSDISVEYTLEEYTSTVVQTIQYICDLKSKKHPIICSESGRFIVSHHSILIFEVISSSTLNYNNAPTMSYTRLKHFVDGLSEEARAAYDNMCIEAVNGEHDKCMFYMEQLKQMCIEQFKQGRFRIEYLADVDCLYELVHNNNHPQVRSYHVNLSVFSSIPEFIGIKQLFPIVPIHRLDEEPTQRGILSDLTCDSDGKIDLFIGDEPSLALHEVITRKDDDGEGKYHVGMFLGGAYEEAIGGVHNLFGGPTVVRVVQSEGVPHGFEVTHVIPGSSCSDVLEVMKHKPQVMVERLKQRVQEFVKEENNNGDDGSVVSAALEMATHIARCFNNITYLVLSSSPKS